MLRRIAVLLLLPMASAGASDWVPTVNRPVIPATATLLGPTAPDQAIRIAVSLRLQHVDQLKTFIARVNTPGDDWYGQFLTPAQFTAMYSPMPAQAKAVADYLAGAGFTGIEMEPNRLLISATGTVAQAEAAFNHPALVDFQQADGKVIYTYTQTPMVPAAIGDTVLAVVGLSNLEYRHVGGQPALGPPANAGNALGPQDFWKGYDVGKLPPALNTTIAIFAAGPMPPVVKDITLFKKKYKLPDFPVTVVPVGAGPGTDSSGQTEFDMDTQTSTGLAGGVKELIIYDGATLGDDLYAFSKFVNEDRARALSGSYGGCESLTFALVGLSTYDQLFMEGMSQGQTFFFSSGDGGGACGLPVVGAFLNGVPDAGVPSSVAFPASSEWTVAAGGTSLFLNGDGSYDFETAWDAGGGGISQFEPPPSWQMPVLPTEPATSTAGRGRGVPDVAMDGDFLLSPASFYSNNALTSNGGTSLSSPLSLGAWARILEAHKGALGSAAPALYALASAPLTAAEGFNDVTLGSNGQYVATPGWDYTTGLGSFDISAVNAAIKAVPTMLTRFAGPVTGNACVAPGALVNNDAAGDNTDSAEGQSVPGHDLRKVYVGEPYSAAGPDKLVFSMDLDAAPTTPNSNYFIFFTLGDGVTHFIGYNTTPAPAGTPDLPVVPVLGGGPIDLAFFYGHEQSDPTTMGTFIDFVIDGALDPASAVDGSRIVFVLSKSKIPALASSKTLTGVNGSAAIDLGVFGQGLTQTVDSSVPEDYKLVGNASCKGKSGSLPAGQGVGALSPLTLLLLGGLGLCAGFRRGRRA